MAALLLPPAVGATRKERAVSVSPIWSVHCDHQGPNCTGWEAQEDSRASAQATARARGWLVAHRAARGAIPLDYCPNCRKELEL
jgi:hypothetical protein